jgi:cardiolipin synthase A/B
MPHPLIPGNRVTLLPDGDETFEALLAAIGEATERVWIETYIFIPDQSGRRVLRALEDAARRGCDVLLLVDRFGAHALRDCDVAPLRAAGGYAAWFNPLLALRPHGRKVTPFGVQRDHRKIGVIDDDTAFIGGRNVSMEYDGLGDPDEEFHDVMVRIEGPAVRDLAAVFLQTLSVATPLRRALFPPAAPRGTAAVRALQLDLYEREGELDHALVALLQGAREEILFCTPYLIPPDHILHALLAAPARGVRTRVLTAGHSDVPAVKWAGRHLYSRLLEAGVEVVEYERQPLHAKFYVADREACLIGSYNADRWGQRYNQEVAVWVECPVLLADLAHWFDRGVRDGQRITEGTLDGWSLPRRAAQAALYGLSALLAPSTPAPR